MSRGTTGAPTGNGRHATDGRQSPDDEAGRDDREAAAGNGQTTSDDRRPADPWVFVVRNDHEAEALRALDQSALAPPDNRVHWCPKVDLVDRVADRNIVILSRADDVCRGEAAEIAATIVDTASVVKIVEPGGLTHRQDISTWLVNHSIDDLLRLVDEAKPYRHPDDEVLDLWPKINPAAFHGLAGDFVRAVMPHTEADPVAVLTQQLVMFGNEVGRGPHFLVAHREHYMILNACLVGPTATGGKGQSYSIVRGAFRDIDQSWVDDRVQGGLVSGEGVIYHVRDPAYKGDDLVDEGEPDKRLMIVEEEFGQVLKCMGRKDNSLSDVIRKCFDCPEVLRTMAKNSPTKATGAHVSIIGHITRHDLSKHLNETEKANGFGNRFLWVAVRSSKSLPSGGNMADPGFVQLVWEPLVKRLREAAAFARTVGAMTRDAEAEELWKRIYEPLRIGRAGLLGDLLARSTPLVMRIACLYALLDRSATVKADHLAAALALWDYCEATARFVFGDRLGDEDAEKLMEALRKAPEGLTRKQITVDVFGGHKKRKQISDLLTELLTSGMIHLEKERGRGRPVERWHIGRGASQGAN